MFPKGAVLVCQKVPCFPFIYCWILYYFYFLYMMFVAFFCGSTLCNTYEYMHNILFWNKKIYITKRGLFHVHNTFCEKWIQFILIDHKMDRFFSFLRENSKIHKMNIYLYWGIFCICRYTEKHILVQRIR